MLRRILFWFIRLLPASLRLKLYNSLKELSIRRYGPTDFFVQRLPFGLFLKQGQKASQEALAIQLVSKQTTGIPVPQILDVVENCFIMTRLEGEVLGDLFSEMSEDEVAQVRSELGRVVQQLRAMPRLDDAGKEGNLGIVSGPLSHLPCCDVNRVDKLEFGPFSTISDFHSYLLQRVPPNIPLRTKFSSAHGLFTNGYNDGARQTRGDRDEKAVFTHGDLNLRNILVQRRASSVGERKLTSTVVVSGIIDWTCAGWYPMYWEHAKAIYPHGRFKLWTDMWAGIAVDTVPEGKRRKYSDELELEKKMWSFID